MLAAPGRPASSKAPSPVLHARACMIRQRDAI